MPSKRLRPMLDEVITDADLVASAERVAADPPVAAQPAASPPPPAAFPPPPWEAAPAMAPPIANGNPPSAPPDGAPAAPAAIPVTIDAALAPAPPHQHVIPEPAAPTVAAVLLGAHPEPAHATRRRRRSASLLPPLPSPSDVPEDAPGRVTIIAMGPPPGTDSAATPSAEAGGATHQAALPQDMLAAPAPVAAAGEGPLAGWTPVLSLGVALILVFIVGVLVTR